MQSYFQRCCAKGACPKLLRIIVVA